MKFLLVAGLVAMAAAGPIGYGQPTEEQDNNPTKSSPGHSGSDSHEPLVNAPGDVSMGQEGSGSGVVGNDTTKSSPVSTGSGDDKTESLINAPVTGNAGSAAVGNGNAMLGGSASGSAQGNSGADASSPSNAGSKDNSGSPLVNIPVHDNLDNADMLNGNAVGSGSTAKGNAGSVSSPAKSDDSNTGSETTGTLVNAPIHHNINGASIMNSNSMLGGDAANVQSGSGSVSSPAKGESSTGSDKTGTLVNLPISGNGNGLNMANGNTVSSPIGGQSNQGLSGLAGGSGNANGGVCSGNYIAQCCQLDVLGAAAVTCNTRMYKCVDEYTSQTDILHSIQRHYLFPSPHQRLRRHWHHCYVLPYPSCKLSSVPGCDSTKANVIQAGQAGQALICHNV